MVKTNLLRYILSALLVWMVSSGMMAQGSVPHKTIIFDAPDSSVVLPPFRESFQALAKNRQIYNAYNDSIFLIKDHNQWVNFFRRRALKNHQIYAANKVLLGNIFDYFERDTTYSQAYVLLFESYFHDYRAKAKSDPFMTLKVCKILEGYNEVCPDSMSLSVLVNEWLGQVYLQLYNLGKDTTNLRMSSIYFKKLIAPDIVNNMKNGKWGEMMAWHQLSQNTFLVNKCISLQEHNEYFGRLKEWYQVHKNDTLYSSVSRRNIQRTILTHDENLIRNVYFADSTIMDRQVADSMMAKLVERNLAKKELDDITMSRTLLMQVKLNQITASQSVETLLRRYQTRWKNLKKMKLDASMLSDYLKPFYTFFYLNDLSEQPFSKKRSIVRRMCNEIELAYRQRLDQQDDIRYINSLITLTTYERITKYLTPKERIRFLNALNVATQVTTYAHSVHVAMIAETLMDGILKYQPRLLVGTQNYSFVEDVKRDRKKLLAFAHDAAMYHDLGKNSIISVVNNDYRPLTDEEFTIIKRHPELGLQYLELAPELAKFHDTTLGHHKWYNGKGGYPDSFDNTQSPSRFLIDIITLSDCMQAATERVGRNYKGDKTFDMVMAEFRRDAGTRYNPDLVAFIDKHNDVAEKLAALVNEGWVEIYYNIYSQFMK